MPKRRGLTSTFEHSQALVCTLFRHAFRIIVSFSSVERAPPNRVGTMLAMPEELMQWQAKGNHTGVFDGYTVIGIKFENDAGAIGWKITPCRTGVDPNHYLLGSGGLLLNLILYSLPIPTDWEST